MNPIATIGPASTLVRSLNANLAGLSTSLHRLSTGFRINRAADDPAGLIASENLRAVLSKLEAETRTLQRADHVVATADAALGEISGMLVEAEGLAVAAADPMLTDEERAAYQQQLDSIEFTINRIADTTTFAGEKLLDGSFTVAAAGSKLTIDDVSLSIGDDDDAATVIAEARSAVSSLRGELGAFSRNTIGASMSAVSVAIENVAAAESVIRDLDYGQEVASFARLRLLSDVSTKLLGMALSDRTNVLKILG